MEFDKLKEILDTLKKNPNRTYTQKYVDEKLDEINKIWSELLSSVDSSNLKEAKIKFDELVKQIKKYLIVKTDSGTSQTAKMANLDITQAAKIIPEFDGDYRKLNNFINLLEFYDESLAATQKPTLLKFVLATKFTEKVRNRLIAFDTPEDIASLKKNLQAAYKPKINSLTVYNDIARASQKNQTVNGFASKIESLIANLNDIQISEQGTEKKDIIIKLNDQIGLNAFERGLRESIKSVVLAARPKSFAEAIQIASEAEGVTYQNDNILHFRAHNHRSYNAQHNAHRNNNFQKHNFGRNYTYNNYNKNNNRNNNSNNNYKKNNNNYRNNNNNTFNSYRTRNNASINRSNGRNRQNNYNVHYVGDIDSGNLNVPGQSNPGIQED